MVRLKDRFRCIAMDYPGFGLSVHPDEPYGYTPAEHAVVVRELVEHLDLHDVVVMGQDWGGPIGMDVASRMPERVGGLAMGNTWFWPADSFAMNFFSRVMSIAPIQALIIKRNQFRRSPDEALPEDQAHRRRVRPLRRGGTDAGFPKRNRGLPRADSRSETLDG